MPHIIHIIRKRGRGRETYCEIDRGSSNNGDYSQFILILKKNIMKSTNRKKQNITSSKHINQLMNDLMVSCYLKKIMSPKTFKFILT